MIYQRWMHSWGEEVILAADGLSALDKRRNVSDKGEVSSSSTFPL